MYSFFVLGLIPGTDIQINFIAWLGVTAIVAGTIFWLPPVRRRRQMRANMLKIESFNASLRKLDGELAH